MTENGRKIKDPSELRDELSPEENLEAQEEMSPRHPFRIERTIRGKTFAGDFSFEVPTLAEQVLIGAMKSRYLPHGSDADANAGSLVEQICYLEVTLKEKPTWWKPFTFREADLVVAVYAEVIAYANKFLGRGADDGSDTSSDGKEDGSGDAPSSESDVGGDAQPSDKRSKVIVSHGERSSRSD